MLECVVQTIAWHGLFTVDIINVLRQYLRMVRHGDMVAYGYFP
jgi:hypothetical protein